MAYIGNTVQNQGFSPAVDYFNGDGTTVTFTLSRPVASVAQLTAVIENVIQNPSTAFTVSGSSITFTSAPPAGTNNVWVEYTSLVTTYAAISQDPTVIGDITATGGYLAEGDFGNSYVDGTIVDYVTGNARITTGPSDGMTFYNGGTSSRTAMGTFDTSGNFTNNATGYTKIATGTTGQRPGTPALGMIRYNTTLSQYEVYDGTDWSEVNITAPTYSVDYLVVAGGGGGGGNHGGGGGAGGLLQGSYTVTPETEYSIVVGAGGAAGSGGPGNAGGDGNSSSALTYSATGGGGGGGRITTGSTNAGRNGGSGGGGAGTNPTTSGSGTSGQGYAGGAGSSDATAGNGGGGGGASVVGTAATGARSTGSSGAGGDGVNWQSLGTYYAGGGSGGRWDSGTVGAGGLGGGAVGGNADGAAGGAATANTGGGGGGGGGGNANGGAGGSGIVIIRYAGLQRGIGGTVTQSGGYTYHTFTSSSTYTA